MLIRSLFKSPKKVSFFVQTIGFKAIPQTNLTTNTWTNSFYPFMKIASTGSASTQSTYPRACSQSPRLWHLPSSAFSSRPIRVWAHYKSYSDAWSPTSSNSFASSSSSSAATCSAWTICTGIISPLPEASLNSENTSTTRRTQHSPTQSFSLASKAPD